MTTYEMENLKEKRQTERNNLENISSADTVPEATSSQDGTLQTWAIAVACGMTLLSIPLLLFPRFILFLLTSSQVEVSLTPLERFLSRQIAVLLLSLAAGALMAAPETHLGSTTHPLLVPISLGASLSSLLAWNASGVGSLGTFVSVINGFVSVWGIWALLFAGSSRISHKTGADKHTSAFLFKSKAAASSQKKEWKSRQK